MSPPDPVLATIAGHSFSLQGRVGGVSSLRIALDGAPVETLVRALAKLAGVRVTGGGAAAGSGRGYLVHCLNFQMVLSTPADEAADFVLAVVSRTPKAALGVVSDLGSLLEHLMSEPPDADPQQDDAAEQDQPTATRTSSTLRSSGLKQGKPLARKTELRRKTPMARGRFVFKPNRGT